LNLIEKSSDPPKGPKIGTGIKMGQTCTNHATIPPTKMAKRPRLLYSRAEDGMPSGPVVVEAMADGTYRIGTGPRAVTYPTTRQLLIGLTHHPEARHWTFDRYFRLGRYATEPMMEESPIMDLFGPGVASNITTSIQPGPLLTSGLVSPNLITVAPMINRNGLGIDLRNRAGEVAKLLFAGYGRRIYSWGYDPEDVLQEVYKGLLIRNLGTCPWDARKSSFGHYVHMVCGCILSNYHRRESRRRQVEQIGLTAPNPNGDGFANIDAADACASRVECATYLDTTSMVDKDFIDYLCQRVSPTEGRQMALQVLPLAIEGHGRQDIAAALNVPMAHVARALKTIKSTMSDWSMSPFIS